MKSSAAALRPKVEPPPAGDGLDLFLQLLAKAVRNFRLYPPDSAYRGEAVAACHEAHAALRGSDAMVCRVTPCELVIADEAIGSGTIIEQEVARRLHRLMVAELTIDCTATARDFSQFCATLIDCELHQGDGAALSERLTQLGVHTIVPRLGSRPEVLEVDTTPIRHLELVKTEKQEEPQGAGTVGYLYPKGKGWVRLDPGQSIESVSLTQLAGMVDDPRDLSLMLLRLSSDGGMEEIERNAALRLKFDDLTMIFQSMQPDVAQQMFRKLAKSVLALGTDARQAILRESVLPGLIEGRSGGQILNDFPDLELADSIGLLLEFEQTDPGVINAALSRLDLPPERRQSMKPLLQRRLKERDGDDTAGPDASDVFDKFAEKWIKVDAAEGKSFQELSAFDLSFDAEARAGMSGLSETVEDADGLTMSLDCLLSLIRLNLSPQFTAGFLDRFVGVLTTFEREDRWDDLVSAVMRARDLATSFQLERPAIAEAITNALSKYWTRTRTLRVVGLDERGGDLRVTARRLVEAFGVAIAPSFIALLDDRLDETKMATLTQLMRAHVKALAPGLASALKTCTPTTACVLFELLTAAGPGYERPIAIRLKDEDETVFQAGLAALLRMGTTHGASAVAVAMRTESSARCLVAEKTLLRFLPDAMKSPLFDLLRDREFVMTYPQVAVRLLERARTANLTVPRDTLLRLSNLTYRFWQPKLVRVGFKARRMVGL